MGWQNFTPEERQAYDHARYMAKREERLAASKRYRQEHREAINRTRRESYKRKVLAAWEHT